MTASVTPATLLAVLILFGLTDSGISVADTNVPKNEVISSISKTGNSSVSAIVTVEGV